MRSERKPSSGNVTEELMLTMLNERLATARSGGVPQRDGVLHVGLLCRSIKYRVVSQGSGASFLSRLLPIVVCAVCPSCMATYVKLLSVLGIGCELSESQHTAFLTVAIGLSIALSTLRAIRLRRVWPIAVALVGVALVIVGHLIHSIGLEWVGVLVLLVGGLFEHQQRRVTHSPAGCAGVFTPEDAL